MLKRSITFKDFDGNTVTEEFRFHLNKVEIITLQFSEKGGFAEVLRRIIKENDEKQIVEHFKELILASYGVLEEGNRRRFKKSQELRDEFSQTEAFSELFIELATNDKAAAEFVRGVVPEGFDFDEADVDQLQLPVSNTPSAETDLTTDSPVSDSPVQEKKVTDYTREELLAMSQEEFDDLAGTDPQKMTQPVLVIAMQRKNRG